MKNYFYYFLVTYTALCFYLSDRFWVRKNHWLWAKNMDILWHSRICRSGNHPQQRPWHLGGLLVPRNPYVWAADRNVSEYSRPISYPYRKNWIIWIVVWNHMKFAYYELYYDVVWSVHTCVLALYESLYTVVWSLYNLFFYNLRKRVQILDEGAYWI